MSANSAIFNPTESTSAATGDGFSVPRLTTTGRLAITFGTGDKGMMVYDTTLNNLFIWNGAAWESVPASGDAGANGSVQYNDNGVVSGAVNFVWDKTNNRVGIGTAGPSKPLEVYNTTESTVWANTTTGIALLRAGGTGGDFYFGIDNSTGGGFGQGNYSRLIYSTGAYPIIFSSNASERYRIASDGVATWSNVGGFAGTAMTLNSTGLLVGTTSNLTGANISSSKGLGTANIATNRFATVEYGSGAGGAFTTITVSFTVANTVTSVIIEALLTGFSGVYLDHVAARYSTQSPVVIRNNASAGTTAAALDVDGTGLIYTLTITTSVQNPVIKVKATAGGLSGSITLPVITFA